MSLFTDYAAAASPWQHLEGTSTEQPHFNEVLGRDGRLRPAWRELATTVDGASLESLVDVARDADEMLAEDGATRGGDDGAARPWRLDPIPLMLEAGEWSRIDVGLAQRAELLDAILQDLYGEQRLIATGVIPAPVIYQHPGFIRQVTRFPASNRLTITATDLGRDLDGTWRVLADRTQAPSGLGYALENRRVLARLFPAFQRELRAHKAEPFLSVVGSALAQTAADGVERPRVVLLTPGTHSSTAFDQAFLAHSLGLPMVRGADLVAANGAIWMRPPGWPNVAPTDRVDVIVRRVDATWSDPLELRAASRLGVAGLTDAVRRGAVAVVNGLGAGVLENPGLQPYLAAASAAILDEEPLLPGVESWWCGDEAQRNVALDQLRTNPDHVRVRSIRRPRDTPFEGDAAAATAAIEANPVNFVVESHFALSQAPAVADAPTDTVLSRPVSLRTFTVRDGATQRPFIGGLATMREGGDIVAKDVWVLKGEAEVADQGIDRVVRSAFARSRPVFSPRALDDLFWAGRYAERSEDTIRMLLTVDGFSRPLHGHVRTAGADALRAVLRDLAGHSGLSATEDLRSLLLDDERSGSIAHSVASLRAALEGVRDQLSDDTWRIFAATERSSIALRSSPAYSISEAARRMLTGLLSFTGVTANMIRDEGWHALVIGRHLERALQGARLISAMLPDDSLADEDVIAAVVAASESAVTYRRRFGTGGDTDGAIDLLIADLDNPRSIASSVEVMRASIHALPLSTGSTRPERLIELLGTRLGTLTIHEADHALHAELRDVIDDLEALSDAITTLHFASGDNVTAIDVIGAPLQRGRDR